MTDLILVLSKLVNPAGEILIPGIKELVAPLTDDELSRYQALDYSVAVRPLVLSRCTAPCGLIIAWTPLFWYMIGC
jgi:hypothetical protein